MDNKTPELGLGSSRCQCSECFQFFSTTNNFDSHREGSYQEGRRCLSAADFAAKGYIQKQGVWVMDARRPEHLNV